jgi:hypothetical protein
MQHIFFKGSPQTNSANPALDLFFNWRKLPNCTLRIVGYDQYHLFFDCEAINQRLYLAWKATL